MKVYLTKSSQQTKAIGQKIAQNFKGGVIALIGDLGAGKTTFTQGFAQGLGIKDKILSPTFTIIREHPLNNLGRFYHIDLYRLEREIDFKSLPLKDIFQNQNNITLIEWAEKALSLLPEDKTIIKITHLGDDNRKIEIS
jgi:tRNA threonylcarbamoyladenosine biosynthesis protein TsaE